MPKNYESTYKINLTTDPSEVIKSLQNIQKQMESLSANPKIFDKVKKEFVNMEKLNSEFKNSLSQGIKSPNDFTKINKLIIDLESSMQTATDELNRIKENGDKSFKFKNIENVKRDIENARKQIEMFNRTLKENQTAFQKGLKTIGIDDSQAKILAQEVKSQEDVNKKLAEEYERRKQLLELARQQANEQKANLASNILGESKRGSFVSQAGITNRGTYASKKTAAEGTNSIISESFKQGVASGQNLNQILTTIQQRIQNTGVELTNWEKVVNKVTNVYTDLNNRSKDYDQNVKNAEKSLNQIASINQQTGKLTYSANASNLINSFGITNEDITKINQASQSIQTLTAEEQKLVQSTNLNQFSNQINNASVSVQNFGQEARNATSETRQFATQQDDLAQSFNRIMYSAKMLLSVTNIYRQIRRVISQTFTDVQNLDKAFGSIAMVTDKTVSGLWQSYGDYAKMANELGQTTESAIQASALFYQQGLDTAEALSLTRDTMKLATLAGADFSTATQQMTAALRGFHMEMDQGAHVTDVYSELAANAAADVNGIAYAMSKTASIASSAGMSFENTAAFLTNMIETTQEAPENIG